MRREAFGSFLLVASCASLPSAYAATPPDAAAPAPAEAIPPDGAVEPDGGEPAEPPPAEGPDAGATDAAPDEAPPGASDATNPWPADQGTSAEQGGARRPGSYSSKSDYGDPWAVAERSGTPHGGQEGEDPNSWGWFGSGRTASARVSGPPPIPPAMPRLFPPDSLAEDEPPLVGLHGGRVFIRDRDDWVRLYPGARLDLDFLATFGPGVADLPVSLSDGALDPQLTIRRVRLELSGELFRRLYFTAGMELGGKPIGETDRSRTAARLAPSSALEGPVRPAVVSLSYEAEPWLALTVGQFHVPFSMDNRTDESRMTMFERPLAIRGFAVPHEKDLGVALWGELGERVFTYEVGVFTGDGPNRLAPDSWPDFVGRLTARPLTTVGDGVFTKLAQIGGSVRYGARDLEAVDYDYPAMATGHGFVLWQPAYRDSYGRLMRVIPSGEGWAAGGEVRLPFGLPGGRAIDLRGEIYYVRNNTREAVDGLELESTERFGRMRGVGWYALVSAWPFGDSFVNGEPGVIRPPSVDLDEPSPIARGLELFGFASGIAANYTGASREQSLADPMTPYANIAAYQFGGGAQYWFSTMFRVGAQYAAYYTPDSGDQRRNQAIVVDNLERSAIGNGGGKHSMHEVTGRASVTF